jgi:hypothetical protein
MNKSAVMRIVPITKVTPKPIRPSVKGLVALGSTTIVGVKVLTPLISNVRVGSIVADPVRSGVAVVAT